MSSAATEPAADIVPPAEIENVPDAAFEAEVRTTSFAALIAPSAFESVPERTMEPLAASNLPSSVRVALPALMSSRARMVPPLAASVPDSKLPAETSPLPRADAPPVSASATVNVPSSTMMPEVVVAAVAERFPLV